MALLRTSSGEIMSEHHAVKMEEDGATADKWDVESMFDPPKHAFGRGNVNANLREEGSPAPPFDKKRKAATDLDKSDLLFNRSFKSDDDNDARGRHRKDGAGPAPSTAPAFEEVYPIKFSLSNEYREDAFFAEYIKDDFSSPRGSPIGPKAMNSPTMYPSPLNVEGSDNLDFEMGGYPMTRLQMSPLSTPPRCSNNGNLAYARLESPPSIKKGHNDIAFGTNLHSDGNNSTSDVIENYSPDRHSVGGGNGNPYHPVATQTHSGGPIQHLSPGQTIYNVASKSVDSPLSPYQPYPWRVPSSHHPSHSTPLNYNQGGGNANSTPEFLPPRSNMRGPSRSVRLTKIANEAGFKPAKYDPITPSPSHIRNAVSDESISPLAPTVHHPPQRPVASASSGGWIDASRMSTLPRYEDPRQGAWSMQSLPPALPSASPGYHHASSHYYPPYHQHHQAYQRPAVPDPGASNATAEKRVDDPCNGSEAADWRKHQYLLHQFLLQFGHCNVPKGYGVGTHYAGLYQWCVNQRTEYQKMCRADDGDIKCRESCTMTPTRMQTLTSMGFVWGRPPADFRPTATTTFSGNVAIAASKSYSSWNKWIELLTEYKHENGNVDVPLKYEPNPSLGTFVNRQRTEYRKMLNGKSSSMTQQRVDDLCRLDFTWAIRDSHTSWEDRFNELKEFHNVNGHCNVPKIYSKNPSLGYWVNEQRFQYRRMTKKKSSYMTDEKVQALNELDFKWTLREINSSWDNWLKELRDYRDKHGDIDVPLKYRYNPGLGAFVNRQRTEYRKVQQGFQSSLSDERIKDLDDLGFKWSIRVCRTPWENRLDELIKFKDQHGHCNVPSTYPKNQPLAYWVFKQRGQYRIYKERDEIYLNPGEKPQMCHMTPDRIAQLEAIGFEWSPPRRNK